MLIRIGNFSNECFKTKEKGKERLFLWLLDDSKLTLDFTTLDSNQSYGSTFLLQTCFPNKIYFYLLSIRTTRLLLWKNASLCPVSMKLTETFDIQWNTNFFQIFEEKFHWSNFIWLNLSIFNSIESVYKIGLYF